MKDAWVAGCGGQSNVASLGGLQGGEKAFVSASFQDIELYASRSLPAPPLPSHCVCSVDTPKP